MKCKPPIKISFFLIIVLIIGLVLVMPGLFTGGSTAKAQVISAKDGFNPELDRRVEAIAIQPDGKILVGGYFTEIEGEPRYRIARLNHDGSLDLSFNPFANGPILAIVVQPDGKILVGGSFTSIGGYLRNNIARLHPDGSLDLSFSLSANSWVDTFAIQPDGKILVGGRFTELGGLTRNRIARLHPDGVLDFHFNPSANDRVLAFAVQPDGKIVVGGLFTELEGQTRNYIARLNPQGDLDMSFYPHIDANARVSALALQEDGKIILGGDFTRLGLNSRSRIARLNSNGFLDTSFNPGLGVDQYVRTLALQPDGKILIGGNFNSVDGQDYGKIARLENDGSLDEDFNVSIDWTVNVFTIALQPDNKILLGGSFLAVGDKRQRRIARLYPDGTIDTDCFIIGSENLLSGTFGYNGSDGAVRALALNPDNKILMGGDFSTIRYQVTETEPDYRFLLAQLNSEGRVENSKYLRARDVFYSLLLRPDNSALAGGNFVRPNIHTSSVLFKSHGSSYRRILQIVGDFENVPSPPHGAFLNGANHSIFAMLPQEDDKIIVGGMFTYMAGELNRYLARLKVDRHSGAFWKEEIYELDSGFNPDLEGGPVHAIAKQPDGKILIGGSFTSAGGVTRTRIARLHPDGSLDNTFSARANGAVYNIVVQPDGKILLGGAFSALNFVSRNRLGRLNADGTLDQSFNPSIDDGMIFSLALQTDGAVVVGGNFTSIGGETRNRLARINPNGSLDSSFDPGVNGSVLALALQPDGKILVGGNYSTLAGMRRYNIGRLSNSIPASEVLSAENNSITWKRSGSSPEVWQVTFEQSIDGINYTNLGNGTRIQDGWELTGLNLPTDQNSYIRARGYYSTGLYNGSSSMVESIRYTYIESSSPPPPNIVISMPLKVFFWQDEDGVVYYSFHGDEATKNELVNLGDGVLKEVHDIAGQTVMFWRDNGKSQYTEINTVNDNIEVGETGDFTFDGVPHDDDDWKLEAVYDQDGDNVMFWRGVSGANEGRSAYWLMDNDYNVPGGAATGFYTYTGNAHIDPEWSLQAVTQDGGDTVFYWRGITGAGLEDGESITAYWNLGDNFNVDSPGDSGFITYRGSKHRDSSLELKNAYTFNDGLQVYWQHVDTNQLRYWEMESWQNARADHVVFTPGSELIAIHEMAFEF